MECPKCGLEIDDRALVCPNCKKVLKLVCPICKTINTTNTCKKCGYVILSKCHNCGKVNQTILKKCKKCGFSTDKSIILNEANSDDYVLMTIDFPNIDDMKRLLGSAKLYNKFKINLDKLIADYTKTINLRRQVVGNTTVIRFTNDYTFSSSVTTAINASKDLLNQITALNCKLSGKKDATIRCNIFLLKRNVEDDPENISSGVNIKLLNQSSSKKEDKILNNFQVLADNHVCDALSGEYKVSPINSVFMEDEMVMVSEIDLREFVKVEYPQEDEDDEIKIPNFVQNLLVEQDKLDGEALNDIGAGNNDPDAIYDIDTIDFEEIRCEFIRTENSDVTFHVMNKFQSAPNSIVAIKTPELYKPYTLKLLNAVAETGQFNNIITITCYDEMKYAPYSFFRELVSAIFEYTVSQKFFFQNDFSMFANIDPEGLMKDLITLQKHENSDNQNARYIYFDIFMTLLKIIPKTMIFVEDFDKIDASSYEVLKYLFGAFDSLDVSFLVTYDKNFSLHRDCYYLLERPYYTEISLKPTTFEKLIEDNKVYFRNILNNFYFQRIAKYACGSSLFIDIAIQYLIESGVFSADEDSIEMVNTKTIIVPSSLDKLVSRRLNLLQDDAVTMKFLTLIVLIGTRVDMNTIESLGYANYSEILEKLSNMGYVYEYNNCIYFPNYNLLRRNLLATISPVYLREVAQELFDKVYNDADMPSTTEAFLHSLLGEKKEELAEWQNLADVDLALGDFNAYVNCAQKILEVIDNLDDAQQIENVEEYKNTLYKNISENLYNSATTDVSQIAQSTLQNIEKTGDMDSVIQLINKMIMGAIANGEYNKALELMHKVLALLPPSSINPADKNFNSYFYLVSLVHVQILFNIGALTDCLDIGYKVLNVVNNSTFEILKPEYFTVEDFKALIIDVIGYVALANVLLMTGGVGDFFNILRNELDFVPQSYDLFVSLEHLLKRDEIPALIEEISPEDRFGKVFENLILAYTTPEKQTEYVYKAKLSAKENELHQLELFCDLLIARAYMTMSSYKKAESIIYKIIKEAEKNGMTLLLYLAWHVMSELYLAQKQIDIAFGIVNNSLIQLEKNNTVCEYILMLFKYSMFKIMSYKRQLENAQVCLGHAQYIAQKYGINYDFDTDVSHYVLSDDENNN